MDQCVNKLSWVHEAIGKKPKAVTIIQQGSMLLVSGRTTYTEAQRLLGIPKTETYKNLAQKIGGM